MNNKTIHTISPIIATLLFVAIVGYVVVCGEPTRIHNIMGIATNLTLPIIDDNVAFLINAACIIVTTILLNYTAIGYNLVKEKTLLPTHFFLLLQLLNTSVITGCSLSNATALIVLVSIIILYNCYQERISTEKGFLIAFLLSTSSLYEGRILYLLPLFLVGFIQMQASSWRTYAAVLIGLITPYWIVCGMGWVALDELNFTILIPQPTIPTITTEQIPLLATILMGFVVGCFNLAHALNEKIHTRAMNGFVNLLSVYTTLLMVIDSAHFAYYIPLLNAGVALQTTYFFTTLRNRTTTIIFYTITTLMIAGIVWSYLNL